ncbi:MAG TPA: hypothetical protein VNU46_01460 [Gemmatimonadaceae bacterium]|nr:hypothetical protein [Gemmatimonadaceae bacterium]
MLDQLLATVHATRYGHGANTRSYLLFSRSGFSPEVRKRATADPTVRLVTVEQLLGSSSG